MHKLFLVRHGLTSPAPQGHSDLHRTLTSQGEKDISALKLQLQLPHSPESLFVCSPATRTLQTTRLLMTESDEMQIADQLYHGSMRDYLDVIRENSSLSILVLVGHNPVIAQTAWQLSNGKSGSFSPGTCVEFIYSKNTAWDSNIIPESIRIYPPIG